MSETLIVNPQPRESGMEWLVAIAIVIALAVGGFLLYQSGVFATAGEPAPAAAPEQNVVITVPAPIAPAEEPAPVNE